MMIKHQNKLRKTLIISGIAVIILAVIFVVLFVKYKRENTQNIEPNFTNNTEIVNGIREHLKEHFIIIEVGYKTSGEYGDYIIDVATNWVEQALEPTGNADEGDYILNQIGGYDITYSYKDKFFSNDCTVFIEPKYYTSLEEEAEVTNKIEKILSEFAFDENTTEFEKIEAIYNYLYENVEYDLIHKKHDNYHKNSTAYGALIYGQASCQGYSVAMNRLLMEAGIDNRIIKGEVSKDGITEYHAWNIVKIGERYYNVDVTLGKELDSLDYFLKCNDNFLYHSRENAFNTEKFNADYPMSKEDYLDILV